MPIRGRITLFGAGVVALTLLLFSGLVYALARTNQERQQDTDLRRRAEEAVALVARAPSDALRSQRLPAPAGLRNSLDIFVELLDPDGTPLSSTAALNGEAPRVPPQILIEAQSAGHASATVSPAPDLRLRLHVRPWERPDLGLHGYLVAGQSTCKAEQDLRGVAAFLIISGVISLLVASAAIWLVAGRALRPLKVVARTADEIGSTGDLSRRLPAARSRDEAGLLTASFNGMLDRLAESYRQLAAALESQRRFVADASHELRTPLTSIRSNAGFLLGRPDAREEDRRAALQDIAGESERMSRLVHDLLTLARADAGHQVEKEPLDLAPVVQDVCRRARGLHPCRCIMLDAGDVVAVCGNRDLLTRLVWLLLDNALTHGGAAGKVRVWARRFKDLALLHVGDDGPGIPEADLGRIFDRFYQADAARSGSGAGLGLAIARWIVEEHGGRIRAYNQTSGGAMFRVELPAAGAAVPDAGPAHASTDC